MANLQQVRFSNEAGIYIIRNTINSNVYIGQAAYLNKRIISHKCALNKNKHGNQKLQRFVNKYGMKALVYEVLEITERDKQVLCDREQHYMELYKPKFNIAKSAYSTLGVKKTKEERLRMSKTRKGRKQTPEQIEAAAAPKRGVKRKPRSEEHQKNLSEAIRNYYKQGGSGFFKGKKHTPETRELFRQIALSRPPVTDEFREKMSSVTKGEKNGMFGRKQRPETIEKIRQKKILRDQLKKAA